MPRLPPMPMRILSASTAPPSARPRAQLASLAYDAVSLVALLAQGKPYHRFTRAALMDPNGFAGVNGIFRFKADGTSERGLAVLEVTASGPVVVSPAPTTFLGKNSLGYLHKISCHSREAILQPLVVALALAAVLQSRD